MPESFMLLCLEITAVELLELSGTPHQRRRWCSEDGWIEHPLNP
jgi:pyridoxamine 5'-phosphate oxidase